MPLRYAGVVLPLVFHKGNGGMILAGSMREAKPHRRSSIDEYKHHNMYLCPDHFALLKTFLHKHRKVARNLQIDHN